MFSLINDCKNGKNASNFPVIWIYFLSEEKYCLSGRKYYLSGNEYCLSQQIYFPNAQNHIVSNEISSTYASITTGFLLSFAFCSAAFNSSRFFAVYPSPPHATANAAKSIFASWIFVGVLPIYSCSVSINWIFWLLNTTIIIGKSYFTAVTKSCMPIENPPSPIKATTWRSG